MRTGHGCRDADHVWREAGIKPIPDLMFANVVEAVDFAVSYRALGQRVIDMMHLPTDPERPLMIGVCGKSRSGKSVLAHAVERTLRDEGHVCLRVSLDNWMMPLAQRSAMLPNCIVDFSPPKWLTYFYAKSRPPLDENALLAPLDQYSVSKAAADFALGAGTVVAKCIRLRPLDHPGPGQSEAFVVPAFAMQIARIEARLAPPIIRVGNLDAQRDFLDVRDVANAYALVIKNLEGLESGTVLNIASGIPHRISDILASLVTRSRVGISVEQDPVRQRPGDLPILVGDAGRARKLLHWKPEYSLEDTLTALLNDCRERAAQ